MYNIEGTDHVATIQRAWAAERPDVNTSAMAVIGRIHRIAAALTTQLTAVYAQFGLSEAEFDLLAALRRAGGPFERPAGNLAAHTMVTTGGLTKRVDRLAERGLVTRSRGGADARMRMVTLTPAGRTLIDEAFTAHMQNEQRLMSQLTEADAAALRPILTRWAEALED